MDFLDARSRDFMNKEIAKDQYKMNKLHKIKDALEQLARKDVETMKEIKVRRMQREKAAMESMFGRKFTKIGDEKKAENRRLNAKKAIQDAIRGAERKSL